MKLKYFQKLDTRVDKNLLEFQLKAMKICIECLDDCRRLLKLIASHKDKRKMVAHKRFCRSLISGVAIS